MEDHYIVQDDKRIVKKAFRRKFEKKSAEQERQEMKLYKKLYFDLDKCGDPQSIISKEYSLFSYSLATGNFDQYTKGFSHSTYLYSCKTKAKFLVAQSKINLKFDGQLYDDRPIQFRVLDDLKVEASAQLGTDNRFLVEISVGTKLALINLTCRAVCSKGFYNKYHELHSCGSIWNGRRVLAGPTNYFPVQRYSDYTPEKATQEERYKFSSHLAVSIANTALERVPDLGLFVSRMSPDFERHMLSCVLSDLSFMWVYYHEEAHIRLGHLNFLKRSSIENRKLVLNEVPKLQFSNLPNKARAAFEWQADRLASESLCDHIFNSYEEIQHFIPHHFSDSWQNILRLTIVAAGTVAILFDIQRQVSGSSGEHPSVEARLLTIIRYAWGRVQSREFSSNNSQNRPATDLDIRFLPDLISIVTSALIDLDSLYCTTHEELPSGSLLFPRLFREHETADAAAMMATFYSAEVMGMFLNAENYGLSGSVYFDDVREGCLDSEVNLELFDLCRLEAELVVSELYSLIDYSDTEFWHQMTVDRAEARPLFK